MKEAIDLQGNTVMVAATTPTDNKGGVRHLLTPERQAQEAEKEAVYLSEAPERALEKVYRARNKERGSITKQWEFFIDNGYTKLKARDDQIKLNHPKGE